MDHSHLPLYPPFSISIIGYAKMQKALKNSAMNLLMFLSVVSGLVLLLLPLSAASGGEAEQQPNSQIAVMGIVYCDICSNNSFSRHSYFLPGVEVKIDCEFKANSLRMKEMITFSVKRTTNRYGIYKLEIPDVEGVKCAEDESSVVLSCQATLMSSSAKSCNVPGHMATSDQVSFKSKQTNLCIYSLNTLNFRPSKRDHNLCGR